MKLIITGYVVNYGDVEIDAHTVYAAAVRLAQQHYPEAELIDGGRQRGAHGGQIFSAAIGGIDDLDDDGAEAAAARLNDIFQEIEFCA